MGIFRAPVAVKNFLQPKSNVLIVAFRLRRIEDYPDAARAQKVVG